MALISYKLEKRSKIQELIVQLKKKNEEEKEDIEWQQKRELFKQEMRDIVSNEVKWMAPASIDSKWNSMQIFFYLKKKIDSMQESISSLTPKIHDMK